MKRIIDNKLYDTQTAEKLCSFIRKVNKGKILWCPDYYYTPTHSFELYQTKKGAFFECDIDDLVITPLTEEKGKGILRDLYPDEYIKRFGEVTEA
jgi:hypothetical protein